ncbi:MAG: tryptophan--tRNA ligase [Christensenellaceae bacterium]|nr:tryptophan--tRNA ligase [Christensenellaceae bacterium]
MDEAKEIVFSGIQPSGLLTIGNYIGALKSWVQLQEEFTALYCVVDLHALTVRQNPAELRRRCVETLALFIACGLDPKKNIMYCQSHVPAHAELSWLLNCHTYMGELQRMTQFKDKSQKHEDNINAGLFTYPVLMAADILLYGSHLVPIGDDQKQHLEICRDIAIRFNNAYGDTFVVPDAYIPKVGARVMSITEPSAKMSKSGEEGSYIAILDEPDAIARKLRRAVTDSDGEIRFDPEQKPGVSNLLTILHAFSGESIEALVQKLAGKGYGELKNAVAEACIAGLAPVQAEYKRILNEKSFLEEVMRDGAERAGAIAHKTMLKVRKRLGLAPYKL